MVEATWEAVLHHASSDTWIVWTQPMKKCLSDIGTISIAVRHRPHSPDFYICLLANFSEHEASFCFHEKGLTAAMVSRVCTTPSGMSSNPQAATFPARLRASCCSNTFRSEHSLRNWSKCLSYDAAIVNGEMSLNCCLGAPDVKAVLCSMPAAYIYRGCLIANVYLNVTASSQPVALVTASTE